jgi:hypothetical protein
MELSKVIEVGDAHLEKQYAPIKMTELGKIIEAGVVQTEKYYRHL